MAAHAVVLAVTRRARDDVAARFAGVAIEAARRRDPAGAMERARRIRGREVGRAAHAEPAALVTRDAERLRAMAGAAVGRAAARVDRVCERVVAGMELGRLG